MPPSGDALGSGSAGSGVETGVGAKKKVVGATSVFVAIALVGLAVSYAWLWTVDGPDEHTVVAHDYAEMRCGIEVEPNPTEDYVDSRSGRRIWTLPAEGDRQVFVSRDQYAHPMLLRAASPDADPDAAYHVWCGRHAPSTATEREAWNYGDPETYEWFPWGKGDRTIEMMREAS